MDYILFIKFDRMQVHLRIDSSKFVIQIRVQIQFLGHPKLEQMTAKLLN